VLLSTPLHATSNFTISVQLANKRGFKENVIAIAFETSRVYANKIQLTGRYGTLKREIGTPNCIKIF
jgi:hypothetical protein